MGKAGEGSAGNKPPRNWAKSRVCEWKKEQGFFLDRQTGID